jgi:hypothetical protein
MAQLSTKLPFDLMLTKWASELNPIIAKPIINGLQLEEIKMVSGTNVINHTLDRIQQGWIITDINAASTIFRTQPFNDKTLTLSSANPCTINLWVF